MGLAGLPQANLSYVLFALLLGVVCFCAGLFFARRSQRATTDYWMNHLQGALRTYSIANAPTYDRGRAGTYYSASAGAVAALRNAVQEGLKLLHSLPADTPTDPSHPQFLAILKLVEGVFEGAKLQEVMAKLKKAANFGQLIAAFEWLLDQLSHM